MTEFITFQKSNCKNCYKCIRRCPVKSIRFSGSHANIVPDECILCGQCYVVCPQNAKRAADETELVKTLLKCPEPVVASVAPSFVAYFGCGIEALREALCHLGFHTAEETAIGATIVKREYERISMDGRQDVIITSCCHTVNLLIEKYYPALVGCLAPVVTPMQAHCADIKRRFPGARTVFIGPCLSKKDEADVSGIEAALTFDELARMLDEAGIALERRPDRSEDSLARVFPISGGIIKTLQKRNPEYTYLPIDGLENCRRVLDDIAAGGVHRCFIEMSSCAGGCIGGPVMEKHFGRLLTSYQAVLGYAGGRDFAVKQPPREATAASYQPIDLSKPEPTEAEIAAIMRKMGKFRKENELNCGTCGYNTCREKAVAVYRGKAEIDMCLPHLMEKSERFSSNIFDNTPNGVMVLNDSLEVQQINAAAMRMLRINSRSDVLGEPVVRILDPICFTDVLNKGRRVVNQRDYYAEFDRYLELTIVHDRISGTLMAIFRDVSDEENERRSKEALSRQTVETADRVVDKQMRIVQEIASLLGETAAETKIALTKLKESISNEDSK